MINKIENGLCVLGVSVGIAQIESILGIIVLVLNISIILYKMIINIIKKVKAKNFDEIVEILEDSKEDIQNITTNIKK